MIQDCSFKAAREATFYAIGQKSVAHERSFAGLAKITQGRTHSSAPAIRIERVWLFGCDGVGNPTSRANNAREMGHPKLRPGARVFFPLPALIAEGHLRLLVEHQRPNEAERSAGVRHLNRHRQHARNPALQVHDTG